MKIPLPTAPSRHGFWRLALLLGSLVASLHAQRITVTDRQAAPVLVESAVINTEITGRFAVTSFDLVFRNPNGRALEGMLEFPLLDGQSVVGLSLDIDGHQRDAVPVEKDKGRVVFEEIERRRVDPALLEKTAGNNYRLRIFPLPANGTRRVVITYQQDLAGGEKAPTYRLALDFPDPLKIFKLAVNLQTAGPAAAQVHTTLPLSIPAWQEGRLLAWDRTQFTARGVLEVALPSSQGPQILTERRGDKEYFYAEVPFPASTPALRPAPQVVGLLWDASGSGRKRDHDREFALLAAWFATVKNTEVRLQVFRDQAEAPLAFNVVGGDWSALRTVLEKITYDGATSFDGLQDDSAVGEWLMFSDGLANYGLRQTAAALPLHAPVHTILACPSANPALLRGLARRQAGNFVNLLAMKPAEAARQLRQNSPRVLQLDYDPEQAAQIFPEVNSPVREGRLIVTGILKTSAAAIRLQVGTDDAQAQEITLHVRSGENPSRLTARAWAATKIASLEDDPATNRDDIRRTSQEFCIVTADTSLIVLETLQDYLRYDIVPPAELRAAWDACRRTTDNARWKDHTDKLARILQRFSEKTQWWETKFPGEMPPSLKVDAPAAATGTASAATSAAEINSVEPVSTTTSQVTGEEVVVLSPFVIEAEDDRGYQASETLAGTRIRTELQDIGSSISVAVSQSLADTNATSSDDVLAYTTSTETAGTRGNFASAPGPSAPATGISLRRWEANAGYLDRLRRAAPEKQYSIYLEERSEHASQPGFFLDVADFFFEAKTPALARRILSNLAELQLEDPALLRVLAHRLVQADHPELAKPLFERVLALRPEEPQSRRDLALACAALKQNQRAVELLWEIVSQTWDGRFPDIEMIALGELNAIVATCGELLDLSRLDARLLRNLPVGLRVVLTWDANDCDIDLWVDDPNGEQAFYNHPRTFQGGHMSRDFTGGYGPEEFLLRAPKPGQYKVRINYYGDGRQSVFGPVTAQLRLITGFGTPAEKEQRLTVRLSADKETLEIGDIIIGQ